MGLVDRLMRYGVQVGVVLFCKKYAGCGGGSRGRVTVFVEKYDG